MTPDPPRERMFVDEETLKNVLDARFATFELRIERLLNERQKDSVSQREHIDLVKVVTAQGEAISGLERWRNRIAGMVTVAVLLGGAALEITIKHWF